MNIYKALNISNQLGPIAFDNYTLNQNQSVLIYDITANVRKAQAAGLISVTPIVSDVVVTSQTVTDALGYVPQPTLVSATNIKTINGQSILGSGDLVVSGTGTVTSVSVVSANGFAGSVATNTSTPAITITTSVTGLLKGNGTAISAATAGTDYLVPSGSGSALTGITVSQVSGSEATANKDATGGYVGLTLFKHNFRNAANTFTSFLTNANTASRTYTFQDRDGTIADNTDLATKQATLVSATNIKTINGVSILGSGDMVISGGGTPGGSTLQLQYNNAGSFAGATNVEIESNNLRLKTSATPSTPSAGGAQIFSKAYGGRILPHFINENAEVFTLSPFIGKRSFSIVGATPENTAITALNTICSTTGTVTAATIASTTLHTSIKRVEMLATSALNAVVGFRSAHKVWAGNAARYGGYSTTIRWGPATNVAIATLYAFVGMRVSPGSPTDVAPSTLTNCVGMGIDASVDTNYQIYYNDASGTASKIDLGSNFPKSTADRTDVYDVTIYCKANGTTISYEVVNLTTGNSATGTLSTDIPANTVFVSPYAYMSVGGATAAIGIAMYGMWTDSEM